MTLTLSQAMMVYEKVAGNDGSLAVGFYPAYVNAIGVKKDPELIVVAKNDRHQVLWSSDERGGVGMPPLGFSSRRPGMINPFASGPFGGPMPHPGFGSSQTKRDKLPQLVASVLKDTIETEDYLAEPTTDGAVIWLDQVSRQDLQSRIEAEQTALKQREESAKFEDFIDVQAFKRALMKNTMRIDDHVPALMTFQIREDSEISYALADKWKELFNAHCVRLTDADTEFDFRLGDPVIRFYESGDDEEGYMAVLIKHRDDHFVLQLHDAVDVYQHFGLLDYLDDHGREVTGDHDGGFYVTGIDYDEDEDDFFDDDDDIFD